MVNFSTLVFLFCLIAVAAARSSPVTDGSTTAMAMPITEENPGLPIKPVAESDSNPAAISMPITEAEIELSDLPIKPVNDKSDSNTLLFTPLPLIGATFRPVNRRFPVRPRFPFRHHFKMDQIKKEDKERSYVNDMRVYTREVPYGNDMIVASREEPFGDDALVASREVPYGNDALIASREVPYGNDMILPTGANSDFEEPVPRGEMRIIPGGWMRLHHYHHHHHHHDEDRDSDDDEENNQMKKIVFSKRYNHGRFDREKKLKMLRITRKQFLDRIEEEKQKHSGFMGGVRKFMENYL